MDPATADPINPLTAAFDAATGTTPTEDPQASDFLSTTLAALSADPETEPTPAADTETTPPATPEPTDPKDPLAGIDDDFPDLDDKASPQAREKWGELKKELKQERKTLRSLQQELEQLKSKSLYDPAEVETLKKQIDEYNRELSVVKIESTKEYKEVIEAPLKAIGDSAASIARRYEIDQEALFDALAETDEAKQQKLLTDLVDGMSDRDRLKIYQMADDTLVVLRKQQAMKERAHEAMQELEIRQKQSAEKEAAERKRTFSTHVDQLFEAFEDKLPFHPLDPNETKSLVLDQLKKDVLAADMNATGLDVQAYSTAAGVVLPRLIKQFRALAAENRKLQERVSNSSAGQPGRARPMAPAATPQATQAGADFLDTVFAQLPG